jgi:tRNA threonylcarbamoyladenosine biosynthesis protein TsaE
MLYYRQVETAAFQSRKTTIRGKIYFSHFRSIMAKKTLTTFYEFLSGSPAATLSLGRRLGERLEAGSIIALIGELGCGKTLLTRGICRGLGVPTRQVNSPTFVLVNEYRGRLPVFHLDLYRLDAAGDGIELGIADYLARAASGIMIVEWAEKIAPLLPEDVLTVQFEVASTRQRRLQFSAHGDRYERLIGRLAGA